MPEEPGRHRQKGEQGRRLECCRRVPSPLPAPGLLVLLVAEPLPGAELVAVGGTVFSLSGLNRK
jgi:hypothetical protein